MHKKLSTSYKNVNAVPTSGIKLHDMMMQNEQHSSIFVNKGLKKFSFMRVEALNNNLHSDFTPDEETLLVHGRKVMKR